jgi:hypothetical protein
MAVNKIAKSVGERNGVKIATLELEYPRAALAEFNTHRVFTRNGQSSRAVPFNRMVAALRENFHQPLNWLKNQPGMVATEFMDATDAAAAQAIWEDAMEDAITHASNLNDLHVSKQYVNRLLEPWMMTRTLVTSTKWANFLKLRNHKDALPEFKLLAEMIGDALADDDYIERSPDEPMGGWHLPFIEPEDWDTVRHAVVEGVYEDPKEIPVDAYHGIGLGHSGMRTLIMMSVARCCRLSYKTFEGATPSLDADYSTFAKLATDPLHASPMEHVAFPMHERSTSDRLSRNFHGWIQFRALMPNESVSD